MEFEEVRRLRKKQLLILNFIALMLLVVIFGLVFLGITAKQFIITFSLILVVLGMVEYDRKYPIHAELSKSFLLLYQYEREKLGDQWDKEKKIRSIGQIVVGVLLFMQGISIPILIPLNAVGVYQGFAIISIVLIVVTNIEQMVRNKRIDSGTPQQYKKFTSSNRKWGIVVALFLAVLYMVLSITQVI